MSLQVTPNGAVLSGDVPTPGVAERVRAAVAAFLGSGELVVNNLHVTGSLQVQLRVRVAEVSRSVSKELGINWEEASITSAGIVVGLFTGRTFLDTSQGLPSLLGGTAPNNVLRTATNAGSLLLGYSHGNTHINVLLDALASESLLRELAEPTLVATSGETAKFLAGGEFPIPIGQGLGQISIDYKNFGVSLAFTPTVVNEDLISMKVAPEVSALVTDVSEGAINENGFTVPALTVRRAETTIELGSGQSFAIGGLLQNNITTTISRFPGLGDIPILGTLFRSSNFQRQETELIIIVTPTIVRPVARPDMMRLPTAEVAAPSDVELILRGKLSVHARRRRGAARHGRRAAARRHGLRAGMSASRHRALLLLAVLAGCAEQPSEPPSPPVVEIEGVRQVFALPPGGQAGEQRLIVALHGFAGGRMDALHVALPPGPAMDRLAWRLRLAGVIPRKIRRDPALIGTREIVAERYIALVAPCPALNLTGGAFGANTTRPGFGCAVVADLAAQTSDPADLLGNDAMPAPYADRAITPVTRWLGFSSGTSGGRLHAVHPGCLVHGRHASAAPTSSTQ